MAQNSLRLLLILGVSFIVPNGKAQLIGIGDLLTCAQQFQEATQYPNPDIGLTTPLYLAKYGYPVETHTVTTSDGYILNVFRIPYSPKSPLVSGIKKKAVYLNHGLGGNGQNWMIQTPGKNLAMHLSDNGFDVFLGNCRGNSYSPPNATQENNSSYWDFSWHEMGVYDVPAVIDMILNVTDTQKLYYIGHSMGTTQYFITMSQLTDYNSKIYTGILLAPIAYMFHATNIVRLLAVLSYNDQYLVSPVLGGKLDFGGQIQNMTGQSLGTLCSPAVLACTACAQALFLLYGYDGPQTNYTNLSYAVSLFPDNMSTKSLVHYAQSMDSGKFRQFDYGTPSANERRYGRGVYSPPEYNISRITAPTVFMNGYNDNLGVPQDVNITAGKMNPDALKQVYTLPVPLFNHMDFVMAKDALTLLYNRILNLMTNATYE